MLACKQHQKKSRRTHYSRFDSSSGDHECPYQFYCGNQLVVELIQFRPKSKWFRFLFLEQLCRSSSLLHCIHCILLCTASFVTLLWALRILRLSGITLGSKHTIELKFKAASLIFLKPVLVHQANFSRNDENTHNNSASKSRNKGLNEDTVSSCHKRTALPNT